MPRISVIIATRNRCALLPRAVESARRAADDVEIIIVDDASDDQTAEVCARWSNLQCVRYVRAQRRLGLGGARNVGLISSTAPYVTFLDDDDVRLPDSLDRQVALLDADTRAGMIYARAFYGDEDCRPTDDFYPEFCPEGDVFWQILVQNFIPCPTVVLRRAGLARVGLLEEDAPGIEDWDLWVRMCELFPVLALEEPVAIWRQPTDDSDQFTSRSERLRRLARRLHRDKWLKLPRVVQAGPARRRQIAKAFARRAAQEMVWQSAASLKNKQLREFTRVAFASARLHPIGTSKIILSETLASLQE
jgi:glycosyltransferase involved in cell wall biosynthesis